MLPFALRSTKDVWRKFGDWIRGEQYEETFGKERTLENYFSLNNYGAGERGLRAASLAYFDVEPRDLNLAQSVLLAVIPQLPEFHNTNNVDNARRWSRRASITLEQMINKFI